MKKLKTFLGMAIACFFAFASPSFNASAATETQDGIEVSYITDRSEYDEGDSIVVTISVKNNNDYDVNNIKIEGYVPEGYSIENEAGTTMSFDKLSAGENKTLYLTFTPLNEETTSTSTEVETSATSASTSTTTETLPRSTTSPSNNNHNNTSNNNSNISASNNTPASSPKTGDNGVATYIIILLLSVGIIVFAVVGNKKSKSLLSLVLCVGIVGITGSSFFSVKAVALFTYETKVINITETISVNGTELNLSAKITYDKEIPLDDNLRDNIIDRGDIEAAVVNGQAEVIYNENGDISAIIGNFTENTVTSIDDAVDLLNSALPLFGENFYVSSNEITQSSVSDDNDGTEVFYRYSPVVNGVPVLGSQIIISTDESGNVTSLNSTYADSINSIDTYADITIESAEEIAVNDLLANENVNVFLDRYVNEANSKEQIVEEFKKLLNTNATLLIYNLNRTEVPELLYQVVISTISESVDYPEGYGEDEDGIVDGTITLVTEESEQNEEPAASVDGNGYINLTYYIYANGENAGNVHSIISNDEGASNYSLEGEDILGHKRTFVAQGDGSKYWLRDATRNLETYKTTYGGFLWTNPQLPGKLVESSSFFGSQRIDKTAISVHANMSDVYDFYKNILGRDSYDGYGKKIVSSYDYDDVNLIFTGNYKNAFWSSSIEQMVFGDEGSYAAALDVCGHEFTHAVINYTVGGSNKNTTLTYNGESGALNEAYADIMGCLIEGKTNGDRWLLGEDADNAVRSLASPSSFGQPEHYTNRYTGTNDNGGVHTNSGIFNFAAYKMMTDARTSVVSESTWAKVFYRSLYRLSTNASFLDARGAVLCAAKTLGFDNEKQQAIKDAFDAVGITEPDSVRIVLRWSSTPEDLDSHLVGPSMSGTDRFHVYYEQKTYYANGLYSSSGSLYAADLDYDDTTSYGPEVTTIHALTPGTYYFYVHDYTNKNSSSSSALAKSSANVNVYRGSSNTPIATYSVDAISNGIYWNVFKLTIDNSKNIQIDAINTYGMEETYN